MKELVELSKHSTNTIAQSKKNQMSFMRSFIRFIAAMLCVVAGEFRDLSSSLCVFLLKDVMRALN